jgi:ligand-binding sensor domain-containing protein
MHSLSSSTFRFLFALTVGYAGLLCAEIHPKFTNLSVVQGLSQNSVWSILHDDQGFLWFGTDDGLNKFDGYSFHLYRHIKNDSASLANNSVRSLMQDRRGKIWIGTAEGVNVYDPVTDRFSVFHADGLYTSGLTPRSISCFGEDKSGNVWVGTRYNGVYRIDGATKQARWFVHDPNDPKSLGSNATTSLVVDKAGTVWIGTNGGGINRFDEATGTFIVYRQDPNTPGALSDDCILSFYEDAHGRFWIGTQSDGILLMDRTAGTFMRYNRGRPIPLGRLDSLSVMTISEDRTGRIIYGTYGSGLKFLNPETNETATWKNDIRDPKSLAGNQIVSIYRDAMDNLWLGTYSNGISKFDPNGEHFQSYRNENPRTELFTDNNTRSIYRDRKGLVWTGTTRGLNIFNAETGVCEHFQNIPGGRQPLLDNVITAIFEDSEGKFWIGTRGGLMTFDRTSSRFTPCAGTDEQSGLLLKAMIRSIIEDRYGLLWIGTSGGLCSYDRRTKRYTVYPYDKSNMKALSSNNLRTVFEDHDGNIWIATYGGGINKYDRASGTFTRYTNDPTSSNSLSDDLAAPIREDKNGNLWIGTYRGGLNKFTPRTGTFTVYQENDGLTNNTIFGIELDESGNVWIATMHGLSCFTIASQKFRNYSTASGLQGEEFNLNSSYKDKDGTLLFGGNFGFNIFQPEKIRDNTFVPPVYITSMSVFNKPVHLDTAMTMKRHIVLSHNENSLSFEFVALNYRKSELNQYKYMLEGFDKEWSPAGSARKVTYTNLHPGEYVFRVLGSNNDGVWNPTGASIRIIITPPFWQTWWAYALYVIGFAGISIGGLSYAQKRQRTKLLLEQQHHEAAVVRQKNFKLKEANDEILRQQAILKERNDQIENANSELTKQIEERERLLAELKTAIAEVKTLGGLIPICSSCKKIRDDEGYWNILESYLVKHSDAQFSHGICPECASHLYPEYAAKLKEKEKKQNAD